MSEAFRQLVLWHRLLPVGPPPTSETASRWGRTVAARLQAAGGSPLGALGTQIAFLFDPEEAEDALEAARDLLREGLAAHLAPAFGAEVGPLSRPVPYGHPVDVASLAASLAEPGEVLLGPRLTSRLQTSGAVPLGPVRSGGGHVFRPIPSPPAPTRATTLPLPPAPGVRRRARLHTLLAAVRRGDAEAVAHEARAALAEGCEPAAARRILALARLLRGNGAQALVLLERDRPEAPPERIRHGIARAVALIASGSPRQAVPEALAALHEAQRDGEAAGQRAALATLALAYARLGREAEAEALRRHALTSVAA